MNSQRIQLDPKAAAREKRIADEVEADMDDLKAQAREAFDRMDRIESVVETLIEARRARGMTAADVARATGMSASNISRLEGSIVDGPNPTLNTLLAYAQAINCDIRIAVVDRESQESITSQAEAA
jgi:DNA-binding phage protein